uniref:protein O-GlcNAc transferase n=1 Tax=Magnetococcus massalia (strain MO-1) TaxID=451514 RepID=A0A1S7LG88_MAGMO|nr:putative GT41 : related to UDP-GlcNAc : protein O-b-N-acetylglucosaminyltransferase [Candidatus Magnetococcus massalia]
MESSDDAGGLIQQEEVGHLKQLFQQGRYAEAIALGDRLISRDPVHVQVLSLLALANHAVGKLDVTIELLQQAVSLAPANHKLYLNLGSFQLQAKQLEQAESAFRRAIALKPDYVEAYNNLGNLLMAKEAWGEAKRSFFQALRIDPDAIEALFNLAELMIKQLQLEKAEKLLARVLHLRKNHPQALNSLALLWLQQGRYDAAEGAFQQLLKMPAESIHPRLKYEALGNLAILHLKCNQQEQAEKLFKMQLKQEPTALGPLMNAGTLMQLQGRLPEARMLFQSVCQHHPDHAPAWGLLNRMHRELCHWSTLEEETQRIEKLLDQGEEPLSPFEALAFPQLTPLQLKQINTRYATHRFATLLAKPPLVTRRPAPKSRLRIGYLCKKVFNHAGLYLLAGVLAAHDREAFEIYGYGYGPKPPEGVTLELPQLFSQWRSLYTQRAEPIARQVVADEIDILVDIGGYTANNQPGIIAHKPAPIIISWLGFPGTLGHPRMADYMIGDATVTPLEHAPFYGENLALMPHCYQPTDNRRQLGSMPTRQEQGLPAEGFIFCCFNQYYKLTPELLDGWCQLLLQVPGSLLWLLEGHPAAMENLNGEVARRGVDAKRIIFAPFRPHLEHLTRLQLVDVMLDSYPINGHTTASDALWAGVPVVTRMGETMASRVAASLLRAVALDELICHDMESYVQTALALASDAQRLLPMRNHLIRQRKDSPLFDTVRYARDLERLYRAIWQQHINAGSGPIVLQQSRRIEDPSYE